jgi:hypothetical protein
VVFATVWGAFFDGRVGSFYGLQEGIEFAAMDRVWNDWGNSFFGGGDFGAAEGRGELAIKMSAYSCEFTSEVTTNDSLFGKT